MTDWSTRPAQRGAIIGGVWLIGLGLIFLAQQLLDLAWSQAWPMFLILAGVAGGIPMLFTRGFGPAAWLRWIWPILLVVLGVAFLLSNTGVWDVSVGELLATWWPLILIATGSRTAVPAIPGLAVREDVLDAICLGARELLGDEVAGLELVPPDDPDGLEGVAMRGRDALELRGVRAARGEGIAWRAWRRAG